MYLQNLLTALLVLPAIALAAPSPAPVAAPAPAPPVSASSVNPFLGREFYANSIYARKLDQTIKTFLKRFDVKGAARVHSIQKTGTFGWISFFEDIPKLDTYISEARALQKRTGKKQIVELVVYNLPDRDCSANSSDGELKLAEDGFNKYMKFVDTIAKRLEKKDAKDLTFAVVLEPDSLANLVTNMAIPKCANAAQYYKSGIAYAIKKLQFNNVALYIDAAHGGWLGWDDNLAPSAALFKEVLDEAGPKAKIRGFATNVSNYNAYRASTREAFTEWSNSWDEYHYTQSLTPHLEAVGLPANFIVDVGRSGKLAVRSAWGNWCNIEHAGFGPLPTTKTDAPNVDALVWVKPGGESDGTSDTTSHRYDEMCTGPDAKIPAPEAGAWFDEYVVDLIKNANPPVPLWV